jgi:eukaryotic-like serine/threonine-protein kinase
MACFREAIRLDPTDAKVHSNLGLALDRKGDTDGAIAAGKEAVRLDPKDAHCHGNLGITLVGKGDVDGAIICFQEAIRLDPTNATAHYNFGITLGDKGDPDGAAGAFRESIRLDTTYANAHTGLGTALHRKGDYDGAATEYRKAIDLDPGDAGKYRNLVKALAPLGRLEEARAVWGKALERDPPDHAAWSGYAELCLFLGREDEYRRARAALLRKFGNATDPNVAERTARACLLLPAEGAELDRAAALADRAVGVGPGHRDYVFFLAAKGLAEYRRGNLAAAIDTLQQARRRRLTQPVVLPVLAMALHCNGRPAEARQALADALIGTDWEEAKADGNEAWIRHVLRREAETLIVPNLSAFLAGKYKPADNDERLALAYSCYIRGRYAAAAGLVADALAADPKLVRVGEVHRYNGACDAALAGCGRGTDAPTGDAERARLRRWALDWLTADLAGWAKHFAEHPAKNAPEVRRRVGEWLTDGDLAPVRDPKPLATLPAAERAEWEKLWADVRALLARATPETAPPPRELKR